MPSRDLQIVSEWLGKVNWASLAWNACCVTWSSTLCNCKEISVWVCVRVCVCVCESVWVCVQRGHPAYLTICSETGLFWNLAGRSRMGFTVKHWMSSAENIKEINEAGEQRMNCSCVRPDDNSVLLVLEVQLKSNCEIWWHFRHLSDVIRDNERRFIAFALNFTTLYSILDTVTALLLEKYMYWKWN